MTAPEQHDVIVMPEFDDPVVSIVFPVYGARELFATALERLREHTTLPFEVIAVDNASPDGTGAWIRDHVTGIRLVQHDENLGFGAACNAGAALARADAVCLLNTDAFVHEGWLEPTLETLAIPGAGAVCPQFLESDGALQEAGGLVDQRGNGISYGSTDDPSRFRFRFRRTVDYGSAACLTVRREVYAAHGGLDTAFGIAYCEDLDLAFRLRASGWHTYYEPRAVVTHVRGGSSASDFVTALLERNTAIVRERWIDQLTARASIDQIDRYPHRVVANRDTVAPDRLLVVVADVPDPSSPIGTALRQLADARPDARIALLPASDFDGVTADVADPWLHLGVEIAEEPGGPVVWLRHRLAHYDSVWVPDPTGIEECSALVDAHQPQARRVAHPDLATLGALGWAPIPVNPPVMA